MANITATPTAAGAPTAARAAAESCVDSESHFNGLYQTKQNLRIEGIAEGEIQCDGTVIVAEGARVKAKVSASTITIAGELEGEVVCRGTFQIMPSGQVQATVSARRLVVHEGGLYNGDFHMITDAASGTPPQFGGEVEHTPLSERRGTDDWWSQLNHGAPPADAKEQTSE